MNPFAGKVLAAFPVHLTRWRDEDPLARHPLARDGIGRFLGELVAPVLEASGADGVFLNRFSGVLEKPRAVGRRTDGAVVMTYLASVAELPGYAEWLEPVVALAGRCPVFVHDGMPVGSAALIACSARRYQKLGFAGVSLDVSGQTQSLGVHAIFTQLERRGVLALAEPAPLARFRPTWLGPRPCCTNHERWAAVEREAAAGGPAAPAGIDWYNGGKEDRWEWDPQSAAASIAAGRAVAVPHTLITAELVARLREAASVTTGPAPAAEPGEETAP